jgi:hypothetical protein
MDIEGGPVQREYLTGTLILSSESSGERLTRI